MTVANSTTVELESCAGYPEALCDTRGLTYEPSPFGLMEARLAISEYYARRQIEVDPERIIVTSSTSEAYALAFRLLADVGDRILAPSPSYPLFSFLGDLTDVEMAPYPLRSTEGRWSADIARLRRTITSRTRALLIVCPNNPTGNVPATSERDEYLRVARDHEMGLITDEVFIDFLFEKPAKDATFVNAEGPLVLTLSGLSKVAGLPQAKLSWLVLSGEKRHVDEARGRLEVMLDTYLSVNTQIQLAAPRILVEAEAWQERLRHRLQTNLAEAERRLKDLRPHPLSFAAIDGGWHLLLERRGAKQRAEAEGERERDEQAAKKEEGDDEAWALSLLEEEHVLVHPGYLFDLEHPPSFVVSLLLPPARFEEGLARILRHAEAPHAKVRP